MALKVLTLPGEASHQAPVTSSRGRSPPSIFTEKSRTSGYCALSAMISCACSIGQSRPPCTGISMLDCPEQSHTSPMRIFFSTTGSPSPSPRAMLRGSNKAAGVATVTHQRPFLSACVRTAPHHEGATLTSASGAAQPQSFTSQDCCSTMLSPTMAGSLIFASDGAHAAHSRSTSAQNLFIPAINRYRALRPVCRYPPRAATRRSRCRPSGSRPAAA